MNCMNDALCETNTQTFIIWRKKNIISHRHHQHVKQNIFQLYQAKTNEILSCYCLAEFAYEVDMYFGYAPP